MSPKGLVYNSIIYYSDYKKLTNVSLFRSQFALIGDDLLQELREILEAPANPGESRVFTMARYNFIFAIKGYLTWNIQC